MFLFFIIICFYSQNNIDDIMIKIEAVEKDLKKIDASLDKNPAVKKEFIKQEKEFDKNPKLYLNNLIKILNKTIKDANNESDKKKYASSLELVVNLSKILEIDIDEKIDDKTSILSKNKRFNPKKEFYDPLMDNDIFALISNSYKNRSEAGIFQTMVWTLP